MIVVLSDCSSEESDLIARYLMETSVRQLGSALAQREYILKKAVLNNRNMLGSLVTLTGEIPENSIREGKKPVPPTTIIDGQKKYLVKEQLPCLDGLDIEDGGHINTIKKYIALLDAGTKLEMIVTVLKFENDYLIVDGNKRSIAYYEHCGKHHKEDIVFPVYVLVT